MNENQDIKTHIKQLADDSGFDSFGVTHPRALSQQQQQRFYEMAEHNQHGDMAWLVRHLELRCDPQQIMLNAQSIIMLGANYAPKDNPLSWLENKSQGAIACYALGDDYHDILKKKLKNLIMVLQKYYPDADFRLYVDTAPVAEKPLAAWAGLGWQGKHSNLVSRDYGSWLFLAALFTSIALPRDEQEQDHCGSCQACINICPTAAIEQPYQLNPSKCIAYLTIEHQGTIDEIYRKAIGNRIFGCDDCLAICPWNKFAVQTQQMAFAMRESLQDRSLQRFLQWDEEQFRKQFRKSPVKRLGFARFIRNVLIAAGNAQDKELYPLIKKWQQNDDIVIAETASWALSQYHTLI